MMQLFKAGDSVEVNKASITLRDDDKDVFLPATVIDCRPGGKYRIKVEFNMKKSPVVLSRHLRRPAA